MFSLAIALLFLVALVVAAFVYARAKLADTDTYIRSPLHYTSVKDVVVNTESGEQRVIGVDEEIQSVEIHDVEERTTRVMQERRYSSWDNKMGR